MSKSRHACTDNVTLQQLFEAIQSILKSLKKEEKEVSIKLICELLPKKIGISRRTVHRVFAGNALGLPFFQFVQLNPTEFDAKFEKQKNQSLRKLMAVPNQKKQKINIEIEKAILSKNIENTTLEELFYASKSSSQQFKEKERPLRGCIQEKGKFLERYIAQDDKIGMLNSNFLKINKSYLRQVLKNIDPQLDIGQFFDMSDIEFQEKYKAFKNKTLKSLHQCRDRNEDHSKAESQHAKDAHFQDWGNGKEEESAQAQGERIVSQYPGSLFSSSSEEDEVSEEDEMLEEDEVLAEGSILAEDPVLLYPNP